ncbi:MAG: SCO family protein [Planctomycetota bacterium]
MMRYAIPTILWLAVLVASIWIVFKTGNENQGTAVSTNTDGVVMAKVPWEHLPDIDRFELTDQNGEKFDTAKLVGRPYVVSFFFANCPSICRDLNKQIERLNQAVKDTDIQFLTITVKPEEDTPEVLKRYAEGFGAEPDRWAFLTGDFYKIQEVGSHMFNVVVDPETHTDNIMLVDKWGRYRDRFKWQQPYDMKRFIQVAKDVAAEKDPPFGEVVETRNVMAGKPPNDLADVPWIREFHLTKRDGDSFFSRDLVGQVWICNLFFATCPGICKTQTEYLRELRVRLGDDCPQIVSISTNAADDSPAVLRNYAEKYGLDTDDQSWMFLTGNPHLIKRIGSEFLAAPADEGHHSSDLFVIDRWGDVRGSFDWQDSEQEKAMLELIENLQTERFPPKPVIEKKRDKSGEQSEASKE